VARSRQRVAEALADGGLDRLATGPQPPMSLRWILVHMTRSTRGTTATPTCCASGGR
jgi:hypothetical protein